MILVMAMMAIGMKATAQCGGCTTTINMADGAAYLVGSGQTLCITSMRMQTLRITPSQ